MTSAPVAAIVAASVAISIGAKRRRLLRRFREVGAVDAGHAATLLVLGVPLTWVLDRLVRRKVIVAVPDGRYYLDEGAAARYLHQKRFWASAVGGIVLLALLILWFAGLTPR